MDRNSDCCQRGCFFAFIYERFPSSTMLDVWGNTSLPALHKVPTTPEPRGQGVGWWLLNGQGGTGWSQGQGEPSCFQTHLHPSRKADTTLGVPSYTRRHWETASSGGRMEKARKARVKAACPSVDEHLVADAVWRTPSLLQEGFGDHSGSVDLSPFPITTVKGVLTDFLLPL